MVKQDEKKVQNKNMLFRQKHNEPEFVYSKQSLNTGSDPDRIFFLIYQFLSKFLIYKTFKLDLLLFTRLGWTWRL